MDPPVDDGSGGLVHVTPPECPIPNPQPEIPVTGGDPVTPVDPGHDGGVGDAPIVPEPGSAILLGIAMGVGGAGYIRRRRKNAKTSESLAATV